MNIDNDGARSKSAAQHLQIEPIHAERLTQNAVARAKKASDSSKVIMVSATKLTLHPMLGLDAQALRPRYVVTVARELERLRRGQPPRETPEVVHDAAKYSAFSEVATVIASLERAQEDPGCRVPVLVRPDFDTAAFLEKRLEKATPVTAFEQAQMLAAIKSRGSLRDWMRKTALEPKAWDSKCSKIMKLNDLDEMVMSKIDPFSIGSVKDAGRIVSEWADETKCAAMVRVLNSRTSGKNERIPAGPLFKAMLRAISAPPVSGELCAGTKPEHRKVVSSDGVHIATIRLEEGANWDSAYALFKAIRWQEPSKNAD